MNLYQEKFNLTPYRAGGVFLFCLTIGLFLGLSSFKQTARTHRIEKTFTGKELVKIYHRYGPMVVRKSKTNELRVVAILTAEVDDEASWNTLKEEFGVGIKEQGNMLQMQTGLNIEEFNTINGETRIRFKNGKKVRDIEDLKVRMELEIPSMKELALKSKYEMVEVLDQLDCDLRLEIYSGRFSVPDLNKNLHLDMKYTKGRIGDIQDGKFDIYDCDIEVGNAGIVRVESKYSGIIIGDTEQLKLETYDDKIRAGQVASNFAVEDKYSDFVIKGFKQGRMDIYDSDFKVQKAEDLLVKSKYSSFEFDELKSLSFELSYDDKVTVNNLGRLVTSSKYTEYTLYTLGTDMQINGYNDKITVGKIEGPLEDCSIEGKYLKIRLPISGSFPYQIDMKAKYTKLRYPEDRFDIVKYIEKNSELQIVGKTKDATDQSPKVTIDTYDGKIELE